MTSSIESSQTISVYQYGTAVCGCGKVQTAQLSQQLDYITDTPHMPQGGGPICSITQAMQTHIPAYIPGKLLS